MSWARPLYSVALFIVLAWSASTSAQTITSREIAAMDTSALAARLLGASAPLVRESRAISYSRIMPRDEPATINAVSFATAPRSSGWAGLCVADTLTLLLSPVDRDQVTPESPLKVTSLEAEKVFSVVGDPKGQPGEWTKSDGEQLERDCAAAGPVLLVYEYPKKSSFFTVTPSSISSDKSAAAGTVVKDWTAVVDAVRDGSIKVRCTGEPTGQPGCRMPDGSQMPQWNQISAFRAYPCRTGSRLTCLAAVLKRGGASYLEIAATVTYRSTAKQAALPQVRSVLVRGYTLFD